MRFFEIDLEEALNQPFVFDHPQGFVFIGDGFQIAVDVEQTFPCVHNSFIITANAGVLNGMQMGVVYSLAVFFGCRTEDGQKAHGGWSEKLISDGLLQSKAV